MHEGIPISDEALVLARGDAGEAHWRYTFLTAQNGWISALRRKPGKRPQRSTPPDLFDHGEIAFPAVGPGKPRIFDEFRLIRSHRDLARNPSAFNTAARMANLFRLNLDHSESTDAAFRLVLETLDALLHRPRSDATFFKAIYRLARDEGYPVREEWAACLAPADREAASEILRQPLDAIVCPETETKRLTESLFIYLSDTCHWRLP